MADWWEPYADKSDKTDKPAASGSWWKPFTHAVETVGEGALHALPDTIGFAGDVATDAVTAAKNAVNARLHPDEPQQKYVLPGKGPVSQAVDNSFSKAEEDYTGGKTPTPDNKFEEYLNTAARGAAGGLVGGPRGVVSGIAGNVTGKGVYDATGNETLATIAGLAATAAPFIEPHVTNGVRILKGANHPDFNALWQEAVIPQEDGGTLDNPKTSPKGARGPAQVMPETAVQPGHGITPSDGSAADDLRVGKQLFAKLLGKYDDPEKALAAYNWGEGNVDAAVKAHGDLWYDHAPKETQDYVAKGMTKVYGGPQLQGPDGADGLPTNGSVAPMDPSTIADIMADPEATGGRAPEAAGGERRLGDGIDIEQMAQTPIEHSPEDEMMLSNIENNKLNNVVDFEQAREDAHADKARNLIDEHLQTAAEIERRVLGGEQIISPEDATKNRVIADQLHDMLPDDHAYKPRTAELQDIWRNIEDTVHSTQDNHPEVLTPAEQQDMDASADKPVVDNTGYEKFTPNPEEKTPANEPGNKQEAITRQLYKYLTGKDAPPSLSIEEMLGAARDKLSENSGVERTQSDRAQERWSGGNGQEPPMPPGKGPVARLQALLDRAEPIQKKIAKAISAERSQRLGAAAGAGRNLTGDARHNAALAALKGEYDKPFYPSIKDHFSPEEAGQLMDMIYEHPALNDFEKVAGGNGLRKLLGAEEMGIPSKTEIEALKKVFPPDLIDKLRKTNVFKKDFWDHAANVLNAPRTLMASFDISAPGRQGIFLVGRKQFYTSIPDMFKSMPSDKAFKSVMDTIKRDPNYKYMIRGDVEFTGMHDNPSQREERFQSNIADKIPGVVHSERAYVAYLNKLRASVFSDLIEKGKGVGIDWDKNPKAVKDLGKYINTATGRGSVGQFQQAANLLNATFFSPRLMASRLRLLNPKFYIQLHPFVRKEALTDLLKFAGITTTVLSLAVAGGASVETDPRSTDFAKIKIGKTRIDVTGGFQPYIRLAAQLLTGEKKTQSGKIRELGEGQTSSGLETIGNFLVGKENPVASFATDLLRTTRTDIKHGKIQDVTGQKHSISNAVASRFIPLVIQDMTDAMQAYGPKGAAVGVPSVVGLGVQTYQPYKKQTADQKRRSAKQEWWDKYK